jgi:hypothetical protein
MQKYDEPFLTQTGDAAGYCSVLVEEYPGGATATIYSDDGVTTKANPMTTDGLGNAPFYAANGRYQITVSGSKVVTTTKTDIQLFDPAEGAAASDIGYMPAGTGAVATTVQTELRNMYTAFATFSEAQKADVTSRTGSLDIVTAVNAALLAAFTSGQKAIRFPAGRYYCGQYSTAATMFDLSSYGDDFSIICDGLVEFVCESTATVIPTFFKLRANNRFTQTGTIYFRDTGYDPALTHKGAQGFLLENNGTNWQDVNLDIVAGKNLTGCVMVSGTYSQRVKNINVTAIYSNDCYYGINCQSQGDSVKVGAIYAYQNYRPVFVYGVNGFEATVYNYHNRATSAAINISRLASPSGTTTEAIKIRYIARDMVDTVRHVVINHIDLVGGTISGIDIEVDIESSIGYYPVYFVNYDGAGNETAAASSNVVNNVTIRGQVDSNALAIAAEAQYISTAGIVNIQESLYLTTATSLQTVTDVRLLNSTRPAKTFTPTVVGTSTAGAGTYTKQLGRYTRVGNTVFVDITLVWTAHTGTGNMTVSLNDIPFTSKNVDSAFGWGFVPVYSDVVITAGETLGCLLQNNSKTIVLYSQDPAGGTVASVAMDSACTLYLQGRYEV